MTQEEKQILLKDLCARLPYGVIMHHKNANQDFNLVAVFNDGRIGVSTLKENVELTPTSINECKPYLRPMSSMTEEEHDDAYANEVVMSLNPYTERYAICALSAKGYDWLNEHHFDYRGLIEKGLALEAPDGMYKIE